MKKKMSTQWSSPPSSLHPPGSADGRDLSAHRNPRRYRAAGRAHLLQHLPGQQEPHQPDDGEGHAHANAQCHLCSHGEPGSTFSRTQTQEHTHTAFYINTQKTLKIASAEAILLQNCSLSNTTILHEMLLI